MTGRAMALFIYCACLLPSLGLGGVQGGLDSIRSYPATFQLAFTDSERCALSSRGGLGFHLYDFYTREHAGRIIWYLMDAWR
jgi:hypothetical protein